MRDHDSYSDSHLSSSLDPFSVRDMRHSSVCASLKSALCNKRQSSDGRDCPCLNAAIQSLAQTVHLGPK
jgi:hypothetical protein